MEIDVLINMIMNQGFAVAVAIYTLTRLEKVMKQNTQVLTIIATKIGLDVEKEG